MLVMSLTVLLTCLVLGMDCTIYILCKWAFGEKYRTRSRRIAARNTVEVSSLIMARLRGGR